MRIKIRPRLDTNLVAEARALGLDLSLIVDTALIRAIEAECVRRPVNRAGDSAGDGGSGMHEPHRTGNGPPRSMDAALGTMPVSRPDSQTDTSILVIHTRCEDQIFLLNIN